MTSDEVRAAAIAKMKKEYEQLGWQWLTLRPNCGGPHATPLEYTWGECRRIKREYDRAMSLIAGANVKYNMDEKTRQQIDALNVIRSIPPQLYEGYKLNLEALNESRSSEASDSKRPKRRPNRKRTKRPA